MHSPAPEPACLEDVRLVYARDLGAAFFRRLKGDAGYPLDLKAAVALGIVGLLAVFSLAIASVPKVDPARELADYHNIKAA